jgi:TolB-like protein
LFLVILAVIAMNVSHCGGPNKTVFLHRDYNFGFVERVAVIPFENISREQGASERATRFFIADLLAAEAFDVIEPGEVERVLAKVGVTGSISPTKEQVLQIGSELGVQALFFGSVTEVTTVRSGSSQYAAVSLTLRLVETESGQTIWSAAASEKGRGFWGSIFGGAGKGESDVMRSCIHSVLKTLID